MIKIEVIGNIGKDAEKVTIGGNTYASFSVAVTEQRNGEDKTTWYRAMKSDKEGKLTAHLSKGKKVFLIGKPTLSAYISKQSGAAIPDLTIWVSELVFCGGGEKKQEPQQEQQNSPQEEQIDDLPF